MKTAKFSAAVITVAVSLVSLNGAAYAASPATQAFLENVTQNVDFLDRSSRFALTNSKGARVHDFAFNEAREQTLAANAIDAYIDTAKDALQTGRSAAVDTQADSRLAMGQEDLNSLEGLAGQEFDSQYRDKQAEALKQVIADYQSYIANGDDPALLSIATRELPKAQRRLILLGKI